MSYVLRSKLPATFVDNVRLFTGEGVWRNNKFINIHRIARNDLRYAMLRRMPKIVQVHNDYDAKVYPERGLVWFKVNKEKYMTITVRFTRYYGMLYTDDYYWEMDYNNKKTILRIR
jgi:hypothetical protein